MARREESAGFRRFFCILMWYRHCYCTLCTEVCMGIETVRRYCVVRISSRAAALLEPPVAKGLPLKAYLELTGTRQLDRDGVKSPQMLLPHNSTSLKSKTRNSSTNLYTVHHVRVAGPPQTYRKERAVQTILYCAVQRFKGFVKLPDMD